MNRRTKRRLIVLITVCGVVLLVGVGGTAAQKIRRAQIAETSRAEGLAAYEAGDYGTARSKLRIHLRISGPEAEALTALGDAQRNLQEPNAKHLLVARAYLDQAVLLDPQNIKAHEILLDIHRQLGNWPELAEVAGALLELDPDNHNAARMRIEANLLRGNTSDALEAARQLVAAQDGHIDSHLEVLRVLQRTGGGSRAQREYLENEVAPQHEGTTSMAVLRATVEYDGNQPQRATEILLQAGESVTTDGPGARMLLDSLELISAATNNTDLYTTSQGWLAQWLEQEALAPHVMEVAAGRAWRSGQPGRAVDLAIRSIDTDTPSESVFAWGLLGAMELGLEGQDPATRLRQSFEASADEDQPDRAERWRQIIDAAAGTARGDSLSEELLPSGSGAINTLGPDAVGGYYDALSDAGRYNAQDAISRLTGLGRHPSWRRARYTVASILLGEGRSRDALSVLLNDPSLSELDGGAELLGDAWASYVESVGDRVELDTSVLDQELAKQPDNPVLLAAAGRGALVAGEVDRARDLARRLASAEAAQAAVSAVRFATQLQPIDTQLSEAIVDRIALTATTPRQVAAAAIGLANLNLTDRARELIESRAEAPMEGSPLEWNLARIRLANTIADAESLETLDQISAANASNPRVHIEVLNAPAIWGDLDRTGQVIARLREAQGESGFDWRVFEARRLLETNASVENATAAASLLGAVFESDRGKNDTRAMLIAADAFERAGPIESELQALGYAADGNDPVSALPRLIGRLQSSGRGSEAAERLRHFVDIGNVPPESRAIRLQLLQRQGMHIEAGRDIDALASEGYPQFILQAGLASRPRGSSVPLTEAEQQALDADLTPAGVVQAARLLARVGQLEAGMARLEALPEDSDAGSRPIIVAQYLDEAGESQRAIDYLTRHAETTGDPDAWMEATRILVGQMRIDEAVVLINRAASMLPDNPAISAFRDSIDPQSAASAFDRMARFVASAADRDDASDGMRELGTIAKRYVTGQADAPQTAQALDELATRQAAFYPLWPLLVAAYQKLDLPGEAVRRARDAVAALPGDPRPVRDATQLLLDMGRFEEALGMAGRWRSLATDAQSRAQADMALGVAEHYRGNTQRAIGLLEPLRAELQSGVEIDSRPFRALAEALIAADRMQEAEEMLMPLAQSNSDWAAFMASVAVYAPASEENTARVARWLDTLTPLLADDVPGTYFVASSWMTLHNRTKDVEYVDNVIALAQRAESSGSASWQLAATLATALEAKAEFASAVAAYERALTMAGERVPALLNNAAWLLTSELGEHQRAVALAREAVSASDVTGFPRSDRAVFHHTLGVAQLGSGDAASALRTFDEGLTLAQTPSLRLGRIEALIGTNRRSEATDAYGRLRPSDEWTQPQQTKYESIGKILGAG